MEQSSTPGPYGSVRDLPSFRMLEEQLALFRLVSGMLPTSERERLEALQDEVDHMVATVETFYSILGPRNWVYTDDLNISKLSEIVRLEDADKVEAALLAHYKEEQRLESQLLRLQRFDAMKPRMDMVRKALVDYRAGRYYSTVLVLLAVMDGFVNDVDIQNRRNLNTRKPDEMVPWDMVAGHHLGLSHAHTTFNGSTRKTVTAKTTELLRNGIMHGTIVNFDNEVVATKAWNRLFAVADWAEGRRKKAAPQKRTPTLTELLEQRRKVKSDSKRLAAWTPHEHALSENPDDYSDVDRTCVEFLEHWSSQRWGLLSAHFGHVSKARSTPGKRALHAKRLYGDYRLTDWTIELVRHRGAALAEVSLALVINERQYTGILRWNYTDGHGKTLFDWQSGGVWVLASHHPAMFLEAAPDGQRTQ
ncbi:hypothetical protein [Rhodococcus ruber]